MSEFKLTFGDVSKNQSITPGEMKIDWNKSKFKGKVQESIFNLFDSVTKDDKIDTRFEKSNMFRELKAAAGKDGDVSNLSEDEALSFLKEHNVEGATAQDLFDFFNIALDRPTEQKPEEQKVQEEPVQKPEEEAVQKPPVQEPPVQEEVVQEPPAEVATEQEAPAPQVKEETHNKFENSPNPNMGIMGKTQLNKTFMQAIQYPQYKTNMDLVDGNKKTGYYAHSLMYEGKGKSFSLHEAQKLIDPQGSTSLSVGASTEFSKAGMFNSVSGAGQVGIGENNKVSGAFSYTTETGDISSSMFNAQVTDQHYLGHGIYSTVTGTYQNYQDGEVNISKEGASATVTAPIPGKAGTVLHGGVVYVNGEVVHSTTTVKDDSNTQGSTTLVKGSLGASYNIEIPYVSNFIGDVQLAANISAFNMSNTDEGTQIAGGAYGPFGLNANFGNIPGIGGWNGIDISLPAIQVYPLVAGETDKNAVAEINRNAPAIVTINATYADNNVFGIDKTVTPESYVNSGVNVHINSIDANAGGQYTLQQVAGNPAVHDANLYYSQNINLGNNMQGKVTAEGGYNSEIGAYGGVGVSFNIGNHKKK